MKTLITLFVLLISIFAAAGLNAFDKQPNAKLPQENFSRLKSHAEQFPQEFNEIKDIESRTQKYYKKPGDEIQGDLYLIESVKVFREDGRDYRYTYTYDSNGNMLTNLHENWDNGQWVNDWRYTSSYDSNGNCLTWLQENWENGQWVNYYRRTHTYDSKGNLLTELYEYWNIGQWVNWWRETYTYESNGNLLTMLIEDWNNGQWVNQNRETYTYDTNGNRLTYLYEEWENGQWVNSWQYLYTYDSNGNMLTRLKEDWNNGQWLNQWRHTYTYDTNGNMLTDIDEDWINGQWVNDDRETYTYDSNGNMLTDLYEEWENGQWVILGRITYTYDINGNMLTWLYESWENGQMVNNYRDTYTYDTNGNMLTRLSENWENGKWVNNRRVSHSYYSNGNMLTRLYESWENGQWVNNSRYTYTYDTNDNRLTYLYVRWENGQWIERNVFLSFEDSKGNYYIFTGYKIEVTWTSINSISTEILSGSFCAGDTIDVPFTSLVKFNDGNIFSAQLSDAYGEFNNPINIGALEANEPDIIKAVIHKDISSGTGYRIRVISSNPEKTGEDNQNDITINPLPTKPTITEKDDILTSSSPTGNQWFLNDEPIPEATEQTYNTKQVAGKYTVQLTNENGCISEISDVYDFISGIEDGTSLKLDLSINPNLIDNSTTIKYVLTEPSFVKLNICNSLGINLNNLIEEYKDIGEHSIYFDAGNLPSGLYFCTLKAGNQIETVKMIVIR